MIDNSITEGLKKHFCNVHPLIFSRSVERAKNDADLFDILDSLPNLPVIWSDEQHRWIQVHDIYLAAEFKNKLLKLKEREKDE